MDDRIGGYDICSVWIVRPDNDGKAIHDILGIRVDRCIYGDGAPDRWAIRSGDHYVLGRNRHWIHEPMPSSRDAAFYALCRFDSLDEACAFARGAPCEVDFKEE
jgi:hypothetical protein